MSLRFSTHRFRSAMQQTLAAHTLTNCADAVFYDYANRKSGRAGSNV